MDGNMKHAEEEYDADSIVALKGLEAMRTASWPSKVWRP